MSLKQAVESVIEVMESELEGVLHPEARSYLKRHCDCLKLSIKASEYEGPSGAKAADFDPDRWNRDLTRSMGTVSCDYGPNVGGSVTVSANQPVQIYRPSREESARFEPAAQSLREEDACDASLLVAEGGPFDGDYVPVDPSMPSGANTLIAGQVYTRKGNSLHFNEKLTGLPKSGGKSSD